MAVFYQIACQHHTDVIVASRDHRALDIIDRAQDVEDAVICNLTN